MSINIFLADDHAIVRDGLKLLLEAQPDLKVVGDAGNGREAVQQVIQLKPDIVIMDIAMPELNGIEAARQILEVCPTIQIIILSMHATSEHVFRALEAGAQGYLLKESAGIELVNAIRTIWTGRRYLSQKLSTELVDQNPQQYEVGALKDPLARLSSREREILQLVVEGKSSVEIADILGLSPKTVETYRSRLTQKLGITDLPALVKFAIQHGLTSLE
jgi:RNA polymerase sigma factor (sigma-70 family)